MSTPNNYGITAEQLAAYRDHLSEALGEAVGVVKYASSKQDVNERNAIIQSMSPQHRFLLDCFEEVGRRKQ